MQSFPDREQNNVNNHDVATPPQTGNHGTVVADEEGILDQTDDRRDHMEYDIIATDDTDGGTGSKMLMTEGSYLGKILFTAVLSYRQKLFSPFFAYS